MTEIYFKLKFSRLKNVISAKGEKWPEVVIYNTLDPILDPTLDRHFAIKCFNRANCFFKILPPLF